MKVAVLIGFCYQDLVGSIVDLYKMYKKCVEWRYSEIRVLTDVESVPDVRHFSHAFIEGSVSADFETFLLDVKAELVSNKTMLLYALQRAGNEHVLLYVSGHGLHQQGLLCPDQKVVFSLEIRQALSAKRQIEIWDVCHANSFIDLPYRWEGSGYHWTESVHCPNKIIAFVSYRQLDEKTAVSSNHQGSLSTEALLKIWQKTKTVAEYTSLYRQEFVNHRYEHRHDLAIYASAPDLCLLPSWVDSLEYVELCWLPIVHWKVYQLGPH